MKKVLIIVVGTLLFSSCARSSRNYTKCGTRKAVKKQKAIYKIQFQ